jgi:hypothetical protein
MYGRKTLRDTKKNINCKTANYDHEKSYVDNFEIMLKKKAQRREIIEQERALFTITTNNVGTTTTTTTNSMGTTTNNMGITTTNSMGTTTNNVINNISNARYVQSFTNEQTASGHWKIWNPTPRLIKESDMNSQSIISRTIDSTESNLVSTNSNNKSRNVGDIALEQIMNLLGEGAADTTQIQSVSSLYPLKKDACTINVKDPNSNITKYSIYTLSSQNITYVMCVIYKKNMDLPLITYGESETDPSAIVNNVYAYDVGRNRTLFLQSTFQGEQFIPERIKSLLSTDKTDVNLSYKGEVLVNKVDPTLIDLNIIIKSQLYVSIAPYKKLVIMSDTMISF